MFTKNNIYFFSIFDQTNLIHGISTKAFGSIKNKTFNKINLEKFSQALDIPVNRIIFPQQIHSQNIKLIKNITDNFIENIDGLLTKEKNIFLGVVTADCLPLLFYDPIKKISGIIHAGYRGLLLGILETIVRKFKMLGTDTRNLLVAIGPSIGVCCYNVEKERVDKFTNTFSYLNNIYHLSKNRYFLDLKKIAFLQLLNFGLLKSNIEISDICTKDAEDTFFSYRREGVEMYGEFVSIIGRL